MPPQSPKINISVVTPTFLRPAETIGLLENLARQTLLPREVILVDGAPSEEIATEKAIEKAGANFPCRVLYFRQSGGTAIQRNFGIDKANNLVDPSGAPYVLDKAACDVRLDAQATKIPLD